MSSRWKKVVRENLSVTGEFPADSFSLLGGATGRSEIATVYTPDYFSEGGKGEMEPGITQNPNGSYTIVMDKDEFGRWDVRAAAVMLSRKTGITYDNLFFDEDNQDLDCEDDIIRGRAWD